MAQAALRRAENVAGDLFVDATCIDCDTCRWMAPGTFARVGRKSAVTHQPDTPQERRTALHALISCPTASIGTVHKAPDLAQAQQDFPLPVPGAAGVFDCGYHSEDSFGATSWLLQAPAGNVMVDVPRFAAPLVRRVEALGGLSLIALTHRDDVADHAKWARHFGARRVLHRRDAPIPDGPVEWFLEGTEPTEIVPGLTAIPVPGHTAGHVAYHWAGAGGVLFTGDHLAGDGAGGLEAWPDVCWFDWGEQTRSMERLRAWTFSHVLPGHGPPLRLPTAQMAAALETCIAAMKAA
ncbi:MAG TPA: MBL fold metallo-hydrolase [Candidatus Thermoplasmatota archaeon]|nr:MBL fold metallo-hydrolase [Candidatus Thermoplasmatota archaeon]